MPYHPHIPSLHLRHLPNLPLHFKVQETSAMTGSAMAGIIAEVFVYFNRRGCKEGKKKEFCHLIFFGFEVVFCSNNNYKGIIFYVKTYSLF
jgi:hypothetical protein